MPTIKKALNSSTPYNLEKTLHLFCEGDNSAIAKQYKQWSAELYFIAFRYLKNEKDTEDVVADCFEKLLLLPLEKRKQKFITEQINLKALLIVMVKNRSLDHLKTAKNRNRIIDGIKNIWPTKSVNASGIVFSNENFEKMLVCLPIKEQTILKMNLEGYKHEEISQHLNVSEKSISNSLSLSRSKIKNLWENFMN